MSKDKYKSTPHYNMDIDSWSENSANKFGFKSFKTLDDENKMRIVVDLYNSFGTSSDLEAYLKGK